MKHTYKVELTTVKGNCMRGFEVDHYTDQGVAFAFETSDDDEVKDLDFKYEIMGLVGDGIDSDLIEIVHAGRLTVLVMLRPFDIQLYKLTKVKS